MKSKMQKYKNENLPKQIVVISGPPGVGKTVVIKQMCRKLSKAAHISVDKLRKFVRAGYCSPDKWTKAAEQQYRLAHKNTLDLARNFSNEGYLVFIDDVFQNRWKNNFKSLLKNYKVYFIFLSADLETVLKRNKLRKEYAVKEDVVKRLHEKLSEENIKEQGWTIINNRDLNIQETAAEILKIINS